MCSCVASFGVINDNKLCSWRHNMPRPQVDSIFAFIRQVAVLFRHNNIFVFIRQSPGGTCSGMLAIWDISNKLTFDLLTLKVVFESEWDADTQTHGCVKPASQQKTTDDNTVEQGRSCAIGSDEAVQSVLTDCCVRDLSLMLSFSLDWNSEWVIVNVVMRQ